MGVDIDPSVSSRVTEPQPTDFAAAARTMARQGDLTATLRAALSEARRLALGDGFGVLLSRGRVVRPSAASEPAVTRADELQVDLGEGPGLDALLSGRTSWADLSRDDRWSGWTPQAFQLGWGSVVSLGLTADREDKAFGVLNVYLRRSGEPPAGVPAVAEVFAAHAALAINVARERESLVRAMEGRNLIGQAQGVLMERYGLDAEQAFDVLRRYSSHGNRKLRQVAEDVVQHRRLPTTCPPREESA